MIRIYNVAFAAAITFGLIALGGCQFSQTGSSTHAGKGFSMKIKSSSRSTVSNSYARVYEEGVESYFDIIASKVSIKSTNPARKVSKRRKGRKHIRKSRRAGKRYHVKNRSRQSYDSIIRRHARANGVPYALARAVVQVESGFHANARGSVGEVGLMQLRTRTARGMGYRGSVRGLYKPETNIKYGMRYLGKAYKLGGRSTCGAILKYNAGHGARRMNPISRRYCGKVRRILKGRV